MLLDEIKKGENKRLELKETLEILLLVLREAILNTTIHRDYQRNSDIKVAIYDDIVEIVSPGGFPNGLTLEEVMSGNFVSIVFHRAQKIIIGEKVPNSVEKILNYQEKIIVDFLQKNQKIDIYTTQKLLNVKEKKAREILSNLIKKNILKKLVKLKGVFIY